MKTINETFTDEEYEMIVKSKGKATWRQYILGIGVNKK